MKPCTWKLRAGPYPYWKLPLPVRRPPSRSNPTDLLSATLRTVPLSVRDTSSVASVGSAILSRFYHWSLKNLLCFRHSNIRVSVLIKRVGAGGTGHSDITGTKGRRAGRWAEFPAAYPAMIEQPKVGFPFRLFFPKLRPGHPQITLDCLLACAGRHPTGPCRGIAPEDIATYCIETQTATACGPDRHLRSVVRLCQRADSAVVIRPASSISFRKPCTSARQVSASTS